ncbi:MAG: hypothetical protein ACO222_07255 [Polynucleobacter sp.]
MIEAMKQALEALEDMHIVELAIEDLQNWNKAVKFLRQAIAEAEKQEPVLEVVNGQINRSWDAVPDGFTGLLYTKPQLNIPSKKPQEPWHGSARVDDYNCGWNDCVDAMLNTHPQPKAGETK